MTRHAFTNALFSTAVLWPLLPSSILATHRLYNVTSTERLGTAIRLEKLHCDPVPPYPPPRLCPIRPLSQGRNLIEST